MEDCGCVQILWNCGFVRGGAIHVVKLHKIPDGLGKAELERYLRKNSASLS